MVVGRRRITALVARQRGAGGFLVALLVLSTLVRIPSNVVAFHMAHRGAMPSASQRRTTTEATTALHFMNWFGGSRDGEGNDPKQDAPSSIDSKGALGGVAGVMDSMDGFKRSQRVGKMTGALMQELRSTTVEGVAENGKIKVIYDCQQRPISAYIDEAYFDMAEASDASAAITLAMKDAYLKSTEKMDEKTKNFFTELGLSPSI